MKKIFKHLFFISIFCVFVHFGQAQTIKSFSKDSVKFFEEISNFLILYKKKEGKNFIKDFELTWYGGVLSEQQRNTIYHTCNAMLKRRLKPFPDFRDYLFSIESFTRSGQSIESFNAWQTSVNKLIGNKNKKKFTNYLKFSSSLFEKNAIYQSSSTVWQSSSKNYKFEFDKVPKVIFEKLDLRCLAKGDSSVIYNTSGAYYPTLKRWEGNGGRVYWERAGFKRNEVYADIFEYKIAVRSASFEIDSITFYNTNYFNKPLKGKIIDKVLANVKADKASYPRFISYDKRLKIEDIADNVDFDGGFTQKGVRILGSGDEDNDAKLIFNRDDLPFLTAFAKNFSIRKDKISSNETKIVFVLDEDTISHPNLKLNFSTRDRLLTLTRDSKETPLFNSFHMLDMYFETLSWYIDDPIMEIKPLGGSTNTKAMFESADFFKKFKYDRLRGIDKIHPLVRIKDCALELGQEDLYVEELAKCMTLPITQVRPMLMTIANQGYLFYDYGIDRVTIKEKLYHYINAAAEKEDYDIIQFNSSVKQNQANASINLINYDLIIRGVKNVLLSDSQKVYLFPEGRVVVVKKNRDFSFDGLVNAGKVEFYGKEFSFDYDGFNIDMPHVDSLRMWATTKKKDDRGRPQERSVVTVLENLKGDLKIDKTDNKSGVKPNDSYPSFDSQKDSYAFYHRKEIQKSVYQKKDFNFHLTPFFFDSLMSFKNKDIYFEGTFTSAGIFPVFDETLVLMPDYSLGFNRQTPPGGFPLYGGKGDFVSTINLSHKGLRGDGTLTYVSSTSTSENFIFFPDSVNAITDQFEIEASPVAVEFPPVSAQGAKMHWVPKKDIMSMKSMEERFAMYDGTRLKGRLKLEPKGLTGNGTYAFNGAEMESDLYKFKFNGFDSDTADFKLKALEEASIAFSTKNVRAHIDFETRKAEFFSNGGGSFIDFPVNQYICFMDRFTWFMDEAAIELGADEVAQADQGATEVKLEGSKFISVHPDQDSLNFYSASARFDLKKNIIEAHKIKFINVADALIYPDSGTVVVERKARMRTLRKAKIIANNITQYHTIYNATLNIKARKKYSGLGSYDYRDENNLKQILTLDKIDVDSSAQTYAIGKIKKEDAFTLSPNFEFNGEVKLFARDKNLEFSGNTRILSECNQIPLEWFKFTAEIDPLDIYIPIDTIVTNQKGKNLSVGIQMNKDSSQLYSSFVSLAANKTDATILSALGFLRYDKKLSQYQISSLPKLSEMSMPGNYFSYNTKFCKTYGEGKIDFGVDLGRINLNTYSNVTHYLKEDSMLLNMAMVLDFFFLEKPLEDIAKAWKGYEGEITPVNFDRPIYEKALQEFVGKETSDKLISQINLNGEFKKVPDELNKTLFINELHMKWNKATKSYQSYGKIGLGNIFKKQINKMVDGRIEIIKKRSGDILHVYLELETGAWYYFHYQRNMMQAVSNVDAFNNAVKEVKSDKRKMKKVKGLAPYSYLLGTSRKKKDFLKRFETFE